MTNLYLLVKNMKYNQYTKSHLSIDDIRAMCHSKDHDCATYVDHPEFGLGKPVYESHAIPDENGHVAWYDVEFAHGIEEQVPVEDMQILQTEAHNGNGKKNEKEKEPMMKMTQSSMWTTMKKKHHKWTQTKNQ